MRIVVTGATGNVGRAVVRRLSAEGEHELVGVARRVPSDPTAHVTPDITWVAADLTDDACLPELERAFSGADALVHLVWGFQPSHDVADAVALELHRRVGGAFNLASDPPVTADHIAAVLDAHLLDVPASLLRALLAAAWHLRLQPVDPGWLDLAYAVPLLDTTRARRELGWTPTVDAVDVLEEVVAGMRDGDADDTAVLRPRSVPDALLDFVTHGGVGVRTEP